MRFIKAGLFAVLILFKAGYCGIGETSVITLEFPVGAENCALGGSGVSLAENAYSVFWNPASLPAFGDENSIQFLYTSFYEYLLPEFNIPDLWHSDTLIAVFMNDVGGSFDIAFSRNVNLLNFGMNAWYDEYGVLLDSAHSWESVEMYTLGVRYRDMISLGFSLKNVDSRLAPGYGPDGDGTAEAQVFDFGVRLEKNFRIMDILDIHPALGFAVQSFPQDSVDYIENDVTDSGGGADPLPLTRWYGGSIDINLLGILGFTYANERDYSVVGQYHQEHEGYKIEITPFFAILRGELDDPVGSRWEKYEGHVVRFNLQETLDITARNIALFNKGLAEKTYGVNDFFSKYYLKPNFFIEHAESEIFENKKKGGSSARVGQKREDTSVGISLIGDITSLSFGDLFKNKDDKNENDTLSIIDENIIDVEDGDIVE